MRVALFVLLCAVAMAQVEAPSIGAMVDASGQMRPVFGVAGSFVLGPPSGIAGELAMSLPNVFVSGEELIVRRTDASEARFVLSGVSGMRIMSADWVQIVANGRNYALRVEAGREALFVLPDVTREARRR